MSEATALLKAHPPPAVQGSSVTAPIVRILRLRPPYEPSRRPAADRSLPPNLKAD